MIMDPTTPSPIPEPLPGGRVYEERTAKPVALYGLSLRSVLARSGTSLRPRPNGPLLRRVPVRAWLSPG